MDLDVGETVLQGARRAGLEWRSVCGGYGLCKTCWFQVLSDAQDFEAPSREEADSLRLLTIGLGDAAIVRLACQARSRRDAVVRKAGVRRIHGES
jgi:ferredoxin